ncbi:hypothetical protein J2128_000310 [Methanomicrobium sp. W14]|uniref:hypothetical protein n=1 Tax=Methanomicrobium sp. W14 TaxID=2817839 RepID=UPI001AE306CE|nr:hypothetical protein [Methanomicrobium sp. W14]MBP2132389.1 hypothetical protein [Methanomicrobium sp. W14]
MKEMNLIKILWALILFNALFSVVSADPSVYLGMTCVPDEYATHLPVYPYKEEVMVNVTLFNDGPGPVTIMGAPPLMKIIKNDDGSDVRRYQRSDEVLVLSEGKSYETLLTWDQKNDSGNQVGPGVYTIGVYFLYSPEDNGGIWDTSNLRRKNGIKEIIVSSPEGVLTGNFTFDDVKKDSGVTSSLVSLNCTQKRGVVSFNVEIPEKKVDATPRPEGLVPCDVSAYPEGMYRINGGEWKNFLDINWFCDTGPSQVHRIHMISGPVFADTETMDIKITQFGHHKGKWDYHIRFSSENGSTTAVSAPSEPAPLPAAVSLTGIFISGIIVVLRRRGL